MGNEPEKVIAKNKKAFHDYFILAQYEAGLSLYGTEVKSIRLGKVNLKDSYAFVRAGEVFVSGMHISPYAFGNIENKDPLRERRLLLHKQEIRKLKEAVSIEGQTLVPLDVHFRRGLVKMTLGVAKGKKLYDKRQSIKERDVKREMQQKLRANYK